MNRKKQGRAPFTEALEAYCRESFYPYHTPGHKGGKGSSAEEQKLFGAALRRDLGLMYALDDLFDPVGPLGEAMDLAAELYGAGRTFFSVNGTTACIEAMILAVCGDGDELIIPREAHKSVMNALILSGAVPVYMKSRFALQEEISLGPDTREIEDLMETHPKAKGIVITYPTYDGLCIDLKSVCEAAHRHKLFVLVDEAHGAHFGLHEDLPATALSCGADMAAQSTHKLGGSLTQTSMLHCRKGFVHVDKVAAAMHLLQSTSPHYWFLASLDSARRRAALYGHDDEEKVLKMARRIRRELNTLAGIRVFGKEILDYDGVQDFDETKITIDFSGLGLTGAEAERLLRREKIEAELTSGHHVLCLITPGDDNESAEALIKACRHISEGGEKTERVEMKEVPLPDPVVRLVPRAAWHMPAVAKRLDEAIGSIAAESVIFYPPGIPVLAPGEEITAQCVRYIQRKIAEGYGPHGCEDKTATFIKTVKSEEEKS